jgi:hypothetical protein
VSAAALQPLAPPQDPVERRERRPVALRGHAILPNGSTAAIIVVDLSYDGCGIQIPEAIKAGETIRMSVLRQGVIEAQVRWYSNGRAGLVFEPETADAANARHRERQSDRVPLLADVSMRRLGKVKYRVPIFDASPHGCRVEFVERPRIDELVRIKFSDLQAIDARVCWIEGNCTGLEYDRAIHQAVFDLLVARMLAESDAG